MDKPGMTERVWRGGGAGEEASLLSRICVRGQAQDCVLAERPEGVPLG